MDTASFYRKLDLPEEVIGTLLVTEVPENLAPLCRLCNPESYAAATEMLEQYEDKTGFLKLKVMLSAARLTLSQYREKGIAEDLFWDTMKCFSRFTKEHRTSYGTYGFDRAFWVGRQLSMLLFRLGTLEYEMVTQENVRMISVHIPSDAALTPESVDASLAMAKDFFARHYPAFSDVPYFCHSWLLAPCLTHLLPASSRICAFQARFDIQRTYPDAESYKQWVFQNPRLAPAEFSEKTSLQRAIKSYVLAGGKVGEGYGVLRNK